MCQLCIQSHIKHGQIESFIAPHSRCTWCVSSIVLLTVFTMPFLCLQSLICGLRLCFDSPPTAASTTWVSSSSVSVTCRLMPKLLRLLLRVGWWLLIRVKGLGGIMSCSTKSAPNISSSSDTRRPIVSFNIYILKIIIK